MKLTYAKELLADEMRRVVIKGFVSDVYRYTGAADIIVSRASATVIAELAVQAKATILVPGQLADDHQSTNASNLAKSGKVIQVAYGDREGLIDRIDKLIRDAEVRGGLATKLNELAKPSAALDLAHLLLDNFKIGKS
jgi:UDP-N-acetylglucosamine--N-acetylmuramyl-(pentapeptide) pyrophosphoryl-undecaprenol N-acetylglucosamine transferase